MTSILWLLAVSAGMTAANLYYAQPLLGTIAAEFHAQPGTIGLLITATQLGYATGLLLLVPLADSFDRRRLIIGVASGGMLALVGAGLAPSLPFLMIACFVVGLLSVTPQLSIPYAATLADDRTRGRSVGLIISGLLIGILLSRTVSGLVGAHLGWRAPFLIAAAATAVLVVVLARRLPSQLPPRPVPYPELVRSLPRLVMTLPALRRHALLGALAFGAFSLFWTSLPFRLARAPLHYGSEAAGLFGIVGVAGALAAPLAGRLTDRYGWRWVNVGGMVIIALAYLVFAAAGETLVGLGLGIVILDFGVQANHVSNQTRVLGLDASMRNRLNTLYMVSFCLGGAVGSALAGWTWTHWGWAGVTACGAAFGLAGVASFALAPPRARPAAELSIQ